MTPSNELDLAKLFEFAETEPQHLDPKSEYARCKCGRVNDVRMPTICECGEHKLFWKPQGETTQGLDKLSLGHLTCITKYLASRLEEHPDQFKTIEVALDLIYLHIQSREKEISQISGIGAALQRSMK